MKKNQRTVTFNHNPLLKRELPLWRPRFMLLAMLAGSLTLTGRALYLQGVNNDFLQAKGESRYARTIEIPATRGRITDRHGDMLAVSTPVRSVWALPSDAKLEPAQARELARLLEMDVRELNERLATPRDFVYLKRQLSPEVAQRIADLKLPGIHQQQEYRRYYPGGEVMAHILGFTNVEDRGQEGIELAYEKQLAGRPGLRRVIKDRRGQIVEDVEAVRPPREGEEVALSIDGKIQYLAWSALRDTMQQHKAKAGAAVVIDSRTGEILAMVNAPTFNPNNRANLTGEQLRNRVFTDAFEPGSVMKPFIAGLALDRGKVKPTTMIDVSAGRMTIGTATISDSHRHDKPMTVAEVIQKSSNIGTVKLAQYFSPTEMWQLFDDLGFGTPLNLGFPGESSGRLRPAKTWKPIEQATMSYGHGISVSLIQMARAYLTFAREGELVPLSLTRVDGQPMKGRRIFSPETTQAVRDMLESVTQPGGTATKAQVPGYRVGGKTGTAVKLENGRYTKRYIASFVGFAPVSNPRLVVAVMIDEPSAGSYYAGTVAGPLFSRIMEGSLRSLGVAPDAPLTPLQLARRQSEGTAGTAVAQESM
ncbi:MAG: penicillin-binding protein 2 [Thauera propionica]|jgi:cell division protein FtsI (penicillin-binding protein 3)|uniref:Peptidoglycan D,D-transpeptidase FtsI n=1 Tax=Thauera propionica TaxID=2019431 RepID=A0A235F1P3_9RHOO|nr:MULTISPECIES: penicillin-binding protein 2 [Thauera]MDD3676481.1 penicillin-binding protein 2 [Thauera propionica]MDY0046985.1 penicillin-binding protein 2 [Thauera propionica]OYD54913.1 cell division protein [Thauera propionica]